MISTEQLKRGVSAEGWNCTGDTEVTGCSASIAEDVGTSCSLKYTALKRNQGTSIEEDGCLRGTEAEADGVINTSRGDVGNGPGTGHCSSTEG